LDKQLETRADRCKSRVPVENEGETLAAGGHPVMQNFRTEPSDMEHFSGDKTGPMSNGPAAVQADSRAAA
jgi:hypothetical protein